MSRSKEELASIREKVALDPRDDAVIAKEYHVQAQTVRRWKEAADKQTYIELTVPQWIAILKSRSRE